MCVSVCVGVKVQGMENANTGCWFMLCYTFITPAKCYCWCPKTGTSSDDWAKQSRYHLRTETEPSLRNVKLAFWYAFSVYVQLLFLFTFLVFIVKIHCMFRPNWPSSSVQVLHCGSYKATAVAAESFLRLIQCCSHACVQFYGFDGRICRLFRCVAVFMCLHSCMKVSLQQFYVLVCCIRCIP
jgi:hypothetical protein